MCFLQFFLLIFDISKLFCRHNDNESIEWVFFLIIKVYHFYSFSIIKLATIHYIQDYFFTCISFGINTGTPTDAAAATGTGGGRLGGAADTLDTIRGAKGTVAPGASE